MGSLGMLFYVVECFTVNLENLAANTARGPQLCPINQQVEGNRGLVPVPFCKAAHEVHEVCALDAEGAEVGYGLAQVGSFVLDRLLKVGEGVNGLFRSSSGTLRRSTSSWISMLRRVWR